MRVCHVIHCLGPGGAEGLLVDLAEASRGVGIDMTVVALTRSDDDRHVSALRRLGVPVLLLGHRTRWDLRAFPAFRKVLEELGADVVHTHLKHADLVGGLTAKRLGLPHVSTLHVIEDSVSGLAWAKRWVAGLSRRTADHVVAVSDAQRAWYLRTFAGDGARVVTVRNGVTRPDVADPEALERLRSDWGVAPDRVLAVDVAIMRPGKGHHDLLAAVAALPTGCPLHLVLVGDGELRADLEQRVADDPRLRGRVGFAGFRSDVGLVLQAADLVVHPSHADALPTTLIQAIAVGRPIVSTSVGGIPEILDGTGAVLLAPGDVSGLAAQLERLSTDVTALDQAARGTRERFADEFEAARWAGRLRDLYDSMLARRR